MLVLDDEEPQTKHLKMGGGIAADFLKAPSQSKVAYNSAAEKMMVRVFKFYVSVLLISNCNIIILIIYILIMIMKVTLLIIFFLLRISFCF